MAITTDPGGWTFPGKELNSMTVKAGRMFGKVGDVWKSFVSFADHVPVFRRKVMTSITCKLLFLDVRAVRETAVVNAWFGSHTSRLKLRASLRR